MLVRVLTMRIAPGRLGDWMRYTQEIGFPGMRAQPGCKGVWKLKKPDAIGEYQVVTIWESQADLDRFRAGDAIRALSASAVGLTVPPHGEALYETVED